MINLITLLIGMILVSVIVACLIIFKIHGSIQDVLKSIVDLYDEIGTQTDLQSSMDMRLRIRHIEDYVISEVEVNASLGYPLPYLVDKVFKDGTTAQFNIGY